MTIAPPSQDQLHQAETDTIGYERALLGAISNRYPDVASLARTVSRESFVRPDHEFIWQAILAVYSDGLTISPITVHDRLVKEKHRFDPLYLHDLMAEPWTDPQWAAAKIHEAAVRREVADLGMRCQQLVADPDKTPQELIARVQELADRIDARQAEDETIMDALSRVIDVAEHGSPAGVWSPWPCLNEITQAFRPGQLITVAARPGVGKSITLENLATHIARTSKRWVLSVSLEMSSDELTQRMLSHTARVGLSKIIRGQEALTESDWSAINAAMPIMTDTRVKYADNRSVRTVDAIRASAWDLKQHARRRGEQLGAIMVDYVQLMQGTYRQGMNRQQFIGQITSGLKALAQQLEVPIFMAAQLRRYDGHDRAPDLSDLKESGNIEEDSDIVILLNQQWDQDQQNQEWFKTDLIDFIVAKHRSAPEGVCTVRRWGQFAKMHDEGIDRRRAS